MKLVISNGVVSDTTTYDVSSAETAAAIVWDRFSAEDNPYVDLTSTPLSDAITFLVDGEGNEWHARIE